MAHEFTATYSPDDNKLRLYASARLDAETYQRVKAHGFAWAPKQELFVAPAWSPEREDLLLDLAGEIDDEDTSLVQRAEDRAERFGDYSDRRGQDAERTASAVRQLADGIPLGQPILVGHHSARRARKDAEKIDAGMRKAVNLWRTSEYWSARAAGAVSHAKYKERPEVRARRIKTLEAERRKVEKHRQSAADALKLWSAPNLTHEGALLIAERVPSASFYLPRKNGDREDFDQRPTAYAALTGEYPNLYAPRDLAEVVARALVVFPRRLERAARWISHLDNRLSYERAMLAESGGTVTDRTRPEKGGAVRCLWGPRGGWAYIQKVNKVSVTVYHKWDHGGRVFSKTVPFDKLAAIMTAADVEAARNEHRLREAGDGIGFYLTDREPVTAPPARPDRAMPTDIAAFRETIKAGGVPVVSAPQLFPTPPDLARRVVELADIQPDHRVLEPSAGTGALLREIGDGPDKVAVEISPALVAALARSGISGLRIIEADFLALTRNGDLGGFDRIVMNPPFENAADIQHIEHARDMLKAGGRLVAICANGPRQRARLEPLATHWIDLPAGSFKSAGTNVNTAIIIIDT